MQQHSQLRLGFCCAAHALGHLEPTEALLLEVQGLPTYVVTDHSTDGPEYEQNFQIYQELWEFYR